MQDFDRADLDDSMSSFEAAVSAEKVEIPEVRVANVLAAIDGSNQDPTTLALAARLADLYGSTLHLTYAYAGPPNEERDRVLITSAEGLPAKSVTRDPGSSPAAQILDAARSRNADLIVLCAPYLEDYDELGASSLGTTLDLVLSRRTQPVLIVREPFELSADGWNVILPLNLVAGPQPLPAAWAAALTRAGSSLLLLAVADTEVTDTIRVALRDHEHLDEIDEDRLAGLVRPDIAGVVAALQRWAAESNYTCSVVVRSGPVVEAVTSFAKDQSAVIVATCTTDCASTGYQRVQAIVRSSRNPVLVV